MFHMSAGAKWKAARLAAGMTADQAATLTGYSSQHFYKLEKDNDGVTLRFMNAAAVAYGITLAEIFCDDDMRSERVPSDLRPLLEPLAPLDRSARQSIVKNIASNLRFMAHLYSAGNKEGSILPSPVTTPQQSNSHDDVTDEIDEPLPRSSVASRDEHGRPAKATTGRRGRHGSAARKAR